MRLAAFPNSERNDSMKIAVTYDSGDVYGHFGHTEQFKIYDIVDGMLADSQVGVILRNSSSRIQVLHLSRVFRTPAKAVTTVVFQKIFLFNFQQKYCAFCIALLLNFYFRVCVADLLIKFVSSFYVETL